MARTRLLQPEFFDDEKMADLPMTARLLFAGMWLHADREGRLEDRPERIGALVFPYDKPLQRKARKETPAMINALVDAGCLKRYETQGMQVLWIINFLKWQKPHLREAQSNLPAPEGLPKASPRRAQGKPRSAKGRKSPPVLDPVSDPVSVSDPVGDEDARGRDPGDQPLVERRRIFVLYDAYMGKPSVTAAIAEQLKAAEEEYPPECIEHCFEKAAASSDGRRSWAYVHAILKRHAAEGCNAEKPTHSGPPNGRGMADARGLTETERAQLARTGYGAPREYDLD